MDCRDLQSHMVDWYKFDEKKMVITFENDDEEKVELPARYEVCSLCEGKGSHVNPSIDSNGITSEEWNEWDHEERENYLNGGYDVPCYRCHGNRVEPVPDEDNANPEDLKMWKDQADSEYESAYDDLRCREMGY